jgi:hypothetical protein
MHRLTRISLALVLVAAAAFTLGCGQQGRLTSPGDDVSVSGIRPGTGITASRLVAAMASQDRATPALLTKAGVVGTGTSLDATGSPVIVVYTEHPGVGGIPADIEGVPTRVLVSGKVVPYAKPGGGGSLQMGTSTGNDLECAAGTLGCVVTKGGVDYFLSNNHVFARENDASIGERIDAPGRYDAHPVCAQTPQIATLSQFQAVSFSSNNTVDCAIARPISGLSYSAVEAGGYTPSSTTVAASVGLAVKKTGRTSNLTHATIQAINVTIQVQYTGGVATFVNQIQTPGSFIRSGDSGSLMVTETGNNPVGLCFAGGSGASFSNPIGPVLQALGVTVK